MRTIRNSLGSLAIIGGLIGSLNSIQAAGASMSGDGGDGGTNGSFTSNYTPPNYGTNLWLEITNIADGEVDLLLHNTQPEVPYELLSKQTLLDARWVYEGMVTGVDNEIVTPATVSIGDRTDSLFLRALLWLDSDADGIPDWWMLKYFGHPTGELADHSLASDDYDGNRVSNLEEFQGGTDPNKISFLLQFPNDEPYTNTVAGTLMIWRGVPSYLAVLINDTNFADAVWQPYSTNVTVSFNAGNGIYSVWVGLRGLPPEAWQTWTKTQLTFYSVPLALVITNPTDNVVSHPVIQLQGYASEPLSSLTFDVSNAAGIWTNQTGYQTGQFFDTNLFLCTTYYFQCPDVALGDGLNTITLHAADWAGNATNISFTLEYSANTNAPALTVIWPPDGTYISGNQFTLQGQVDDATAKITASIVDASDNTNTVQGLVERSGLVWIQNLPLANGANTLTVTATGATGNASSTSLTLFRSSVLVTMNPLTSDQLNQSSASVSGTVSDATALVYVNGVQASVYEDGTWEADNVSVSPTGTAIFDVEVFSGSSSNVLARAQTGLSLRANDLPSGMPTGSEKFPQVEPPMVVTASYSEALHRTDGVYINQHYVANWVFNVGGNRVYWIQDVFNEWPFTHYNLSRTGSFSKDGTIMFQGPDSVEISFGPPWSHASSGAVYASYSGETYDNFTDAKVMIVPSGQQTTVGTNLCIVRACASEFSDPASANYFRPDVIQGGSSGNNGDVPLPPEWLQIKGQTLANSGVTNDDSSVWGETIISAPAGENVDITPIATQVYQNEDYTFDVQANEVNLQLAVDANRDGDITFDTAGQVNPDHTTATNAYRFWVNNDHDGYCANSGETDVQDDLDPSRQTDAQSFSITCNRDLEDYTRLWINTQGITEELRNGTFLLALEWKDAVDDPQMQLFQAAETNGGSLYLTDTNAAAQQVASPYGTRIIEWRHLNTLTKYNPFIFTTNFWLNANVSSNQPVAHLLFDAISRGSGKLVISIYKNDGVTKLAENQPLYLKLQDIKEMYERWTVGDDNGGTPASRATISELRLPAGVSPFRYDSQSTEANQYILFVHGWNLFPWAKDGFAETAFKRLYWQGYKGRFGVFLWPTTYHPVSDIEIINGISGMADFDSGEYSAWLSGAPLEILLNSLHQQYGNNVYMFAHSHGNVVAGEALRKAAQDGLGQIVNTYVANQAAVPVHCYDPGQPTPGDFFNTWRVGLYPTGPETPNIYPGWLAANSNAAPTRANFYNANDYALTRNVWETDEALKPWQNLDVNTGVTYYYGYDDVADLFYKNPAGNDPPIFPLYLGSATNVMDRYEIMAFAAEARCRALGTTSITAAGFTSQSLTTMWPPDPYDGHDYHTHPWHSAEFRFTNMDQKNYWKALMSKFGLPTIQ